MIAPVEHQRRLIDVHGWTLGEVEQGWRYPPPDTPDPRTLAEILAPAIEKLKVVEGAA